MSSRLPYSSEDFQSAAQNPGQSAQWDRQQYQSFKARAQKTSALSDLLAAAELAIRCQDLPEAEKLLDKILTRAPLEADAHYLKSMLLLGREQNSDALKHLKECAPRLKQKSPDHARVHRLLAEQVLRQEHAIKESAQHLQKAFELAENISFVHSGNLPESSLTSSMLDFDFEVFDALWPWENDTTQVRFTAVNTDAQNRVYALEQRHQWLFCFDAQGKFVRGLVERDLAAAPFIHPELSWDLTDVAIGPQGERYVASSSDRVYVFDENWQQKRYLAPPASQRTLRPLSIASDRQGNVFVVYLHLGGIHWFNPDGYHMGAFGQNTIMPNLGKNYFCGIAVTDQDQICLYDRDMLQIYQAGQAEPISSYSLEGISAEEMDQSDYPFCWNGISTYQQQVYLCDTYKNHLIQLDLASGQSKRLSNPLFKQPFDVAVANNGHIYVANTGQAQILKSHEQDWQVLLGHRSFQGVAV